MLHEIPIPIYFFDKKNKYKKNLESFLDMYWEFAELCGEVLKKYKNLLLR
jgi:hypothetical protein